MRYYRCKCGERTAWSSMGTNRCDRCTKCGSDLAESPTSHREPEPHLMRPDSTTMETDAGIVSGTITRCMHCHRTTAEITARGEPMEAYDAEKWAERMRKEREELEKIFGRPATG